jgi:hypothetical protein
MNGQPIFDARANRRGRDIRNGRRFRAKRPETNRKGKKRSDRVSQNSGETKPAALLSGRMRYKARAKPLAQGWHDGAKLYVDPDRGQRFSPLP